MSNLFVFSLDANAYIECSIVRGVKCRQTTAWGCDLRHLAWSVTSLQHRQTFTHRYKKSCSLKILKRVRLSTSLLFCLTLLRKIWCLGDVSGDQLCNAAHGDSARAADCGSSVQFVIIRCWLAVHWKQGNTIFRFWLFALWFALCCLCMLRFLDRWLLWWSLQFSRPNFFGDVCNRYTQKALFTSIFCSAMINRLIVGPSLYHNFWFTLSQSII